MVRQFAYVHWAETLYSKQLYLKWHTTYTSHTSLSQWDGFPFIWPLLFIGEAQPISLHICAGMHKLNTQWKHLVRNIIMWIGHHQHMGTHSGWHTWRRWMALMEKVDGTHGVVPQQSPPPPKCATLGYYMLYPSNDFIPLSKCSFAMRDLRYQMRPKAPMHP